MTVGILFVALGTLALSFVLVGAVRRIALNKTSWICQNERSSHVTATPRGGGAGIVVSLVLAMGVLWGDWSVVRLDLDCADVVRGCDCCRRLFGRSGIS